MPGVRLLKAYRPDGVTRAVWNDSLGPGLRKAGASPRRASRVEVIEDGPHAGRFHVDLSLLADIAGRADFRVCLARVFDGYAEAVAAEVAFIERNWVLEASDGEEGRAAADEGPGGP